MEGMDLERRRDNRRRRIQLAKITMLFGPLLLAACNNSKTTGTPQSPSQGPLASPSALCQSVAALDRLTVRRSDAFPQNHMRFSFPTNVAVSNAILVRNVARALCALPKMPSGSINCPADFGITYRLAFFAGDREFPKVTIDSTGCASVKGIGAIRWVEQSPNFWHVLGVAMGLSTPGYATFRGSGPNQ
ncbi:hypothetical protein [Acidithrix sp. C25]|uniref:hypothetical protein n=1 Tax=Acidithrix sp. C25 TaxID=1671482 RepID=UPI00191BA3F7|nr:hypothetical protein [Acidithrix sp. C25]